MTEASYLDVLFGRARDAMHAASGRRLFPPRFVTEGGRSMAHHLNLSEERLQQLMPDSVLYQCFLPSALAAESLNLAEVALRLPDSLRVVHDKLAELKPYPQLTMVFFHMSGIALGPTLAGAAVAALGNPRGHVMVSPRNLSWLATETGQWVRDAAEVIPSDAAGLRRLLSGLRDGSIERFGTLVDGPHPPGRPGTRALSGISSTLGFRTGVLRKILASGVPVIPLAHWWESDRLMLEWGPVLTSPEEGIDAVASILEGLLKRHPEQWLNWMAARLRT